MGVDVYTPAYERLTATSEWKNAQARYTEWTKRPTVANQNWTADDLREYEEISAIIGRLEHSVGHFRHRSRFHSSVPPVSVFDRGQDSGFTLTAKQVNEYLKEWRTYLRSQVRQLKHLERYVNGFNEPVSSPFDHDVELFKNWCRVHRLGEGCCVG